MPIQFWPFAGGDKILFRNINGTEKIAFHKQCCCVESSRSCCCGGTPPAEVMAVLSGWGSTVCPSSCSDLNGEHMLTYDADWSLFESDDSAQCVYSKRLDSPWCGDDYAWMAVFLDMEQEMEPTDTCYVNIGFYVVSRTWDPGSPTEGLPWYAHTRHAWYHVGQQVGSPCTTGLVAQMDDSSGNEQPVCFVDDEEHDPTVEVILEAA
jgi:hypothetical protein